MEKIKIIYEDDHILALDKPAGLIVLKEGNIKERTLSDYISEIRPELKKIERCGIIHRLDKETSGIVLIAKKTEDLIFFQKQFKRREVEKEYIALVAGEIKEKGGTIKNIIGRSPSNPKKQKIFFETEPGADKNRVAITEYEVIKRFNGFTFLRLKPKTGRKHQIRCHLAHILHPIVGDKVYGFKNQKSLIENRHFLHANYIKIEMPDKNNKEFKIDLPEELNEVLEKLKKNYE